MSAPRQGHGELAVLVACDTFLVAVPARSVVRLFLPDEVRAARIAEGAPLLGTVRAGDRLCAAWDLGRLLDLEPLSNAWVVVDLQHEGRSLPIALRTGVCALVAEVRADRTLPPRLFRSRAHAFPAAFATSSLDAALPALFGLWLDPARLLSRDELTASRAAIEGSGEETIRR